MNVIPCKTKRTIFKAIYNWVTRVPKFKHLDARVIYVNDYSSLITYRQYRGICRTVSPEYNSVDVFDLFYISGTGRSVVTSERYRGIKFCNSIRNLRIEMSRVLHPISSVYNSLYNSYSSRTYWDCVLETL